MSDDETKPQDDAAAPDETETPAGDAPEADAPEGDAPESETPEGEAAEADTPEAEAPEGEAPEAQAAEKPEKPAFKPPPPERLEGAVEAVLLVAGDVVRLNRLRDLLGLQSVLPLKEAIEAIQARWAEARLAFEIEAVGGGVRVVTRPEYAEYVGRLTRKPVSDKLSRALLETLCIVAYKQPVGRAEVERIRGVQAGEALRQLLDRKLLKVAGRSDQPGRPLLYGTTQLFLTSFGLDDLKDLPQPQDLKRM